MANPIQHFLRIAPINREARQAFNDVAAGKSGFADNANLPDDLDRLGFARKYMFIESYHEPAKEAVKEGKVDFHQTLDHDTSDAFSGSVKSWTGTDSERESMSPLPTLTYQGYYFLSFTIPPRRPLLGWMLGTGRRSDSKSAVDGSGMVELLLAPLGTPFSTYGIGGKHARLAFDNSGSLTLYLAGGKARQTSLGNDTFQQGQRILLLPQCRASLGRLDYSFEFIMDPEAYLRELSLYFQKVLLRPTPPPDLAASPSPWDFRIGEWLIRGTVGKGSFAAVNAAKNCHTGATAAAKFFVRDKTNLAAIAKEIALLKNLPSHPRLLCFIDVIYERDDRWLMSPEGEEDERSSFPARPERVIVILEPFARATFSELLLSQPFSLKMLAFAQLLQGVRALHAAGFMHRDIKLGNLGVVSMSETDVHIVILDYGQTIHAEECEARPGTAGTIPYLAPEMEDARYGHSVDIWASGVVGLLLFVTDGSLEWRYVVREKNRYTQQVQSLQTAPRDSVENLLLQMLLWDPSQRPTAATTLKHPCFATLLDTSRDIMSSNPRSKRGAPT